MVTGADGLTRVGDHRSQVHSLAQEVGLNWSDGHRILLVQSVRSDLGSALHSPKPLIEILVDG